MMEKCPHTYLIKVVIVNHQLMIHPTETLTDDSTDVPMLLVILLMVLTQGLGKWNQRYIVSLLTAFIIFISFFQF